MPSRKTTAAPAKPARDPDEEVRIRLLADIRFDEWQQTMPLGQEMTVKAGFLDDARLKGKFEEL